MELLLKHNIEHLGRIGDVVDVKPGYARNYLLPQGFAVPVTQSNVAEIQAARAAALVEEQGRIQAYKDLAGQLNDMSITVEGKANDEGHLFGSVTAANIAASLREKEMPVEERHIRLEQPLKEIGVFDVVVHLHTDVEATIKVWVVQQKPEA